MTTKPISGYKIKDGKLVRVIGYMAKNKRLKAAREAAAWAKKNPRRSGGS